MSKLQGFRIKKAVTLPVLKLTPGEERYLQFITAMKIGKPIATVVAGKQMEPATVAEVVDLETGEQGILICATVLQKELHENYPKDDYVGRAFAITVTKVPEKKYNLYSILEIEPDEAQVKAQPETGAADETPTARGKKK